VQSDGQTWVFRLYVAGETRKSVAAHENLARICEQFLQGRFKIEVVDLLLRPHLAKADQIVAIPTLVRVSPMPIRKVIGDLSNTERTLVGLDLRPTGMSRVELVEVVRAIDRT
jgi:circadian clock protein KaiB